MPMTIYKLYAMTNGDDQASLDIQMDGTIRAIHMTLMCQGMDALNDGAQAELSFLSGNSFTTNDTRGSLMVIQNRMGLLTQGGCNNGVNANISSMEVPVAAGERIHLHILFGGGVTESPCHAYLYVEDKGTIRAAGRRR